MTSCSWGVGWLRCQERAVSSGPSYCHTCYFKEVFALCPAHIDTWIATGSFCANCGGLLSKGFVGPLKDD